MKPPRKSAKMRRRRLEFADAFAVVLEKHRTAKKLSPQSLAEKAGVHQTYVGIIERGLSNPSLNAANAMANGLASALLDADRSGRIAPGTRRSPPSQNERGRTKKPKTKPNRMHLSTLAAASWNRYLQGQSPDLPDREVSRSLPECQKTRLAFAGICLPMPTSFSDLHRQP